MQTTIDFVKIKQDHKILQRRKSELLCIIVAPGAAKQPKTQVKGPKKDEKLGQTESNPQLT